ncbi:hypothetical protein PMI27_000611 [Pseudomonas sp. GM41(2012)]|uniref:hypothetical protein n=1 Tax=Pseudomonas sp. (strain GM41(2012)) TaxID=1144708 RepID=UPI0002705401|nr:hypothetical protein [Pseudomonas sp. GM41(2012)]EUB74435.1 hypothetical protein PMI27_000611 [Pseudomonas sp. GM41(2012)]
MKINQINSIYLAIFLAIGHSVAQGAPILLLIDGKVIDTAPTEPAYPTSEAECVNFMETATSTIEIIQNAHEKCLSDNENENDTGTTGTENICSKSACQQLHDTRSEMLERISKANSTCRQKVVEYKLNQPLSSQLIFSHVSSSILDELEDISKSSGVAALNENGVDITATDELKVDRVLKRCIKLITLEDQQSCLSTISGWAESGLSHASQNAIINKIQSASMQRIFEKNSETLNSLNQLKKSTNEGEASEDGKTF